jgi:hypothetical protein
MWAFKDGYPFIVVNFCEYHYAKTMAEGKAILAKFRERDPDSQLYSDGFFSERLQKHVGKGQWFPAK